MAKAKKLPSGKYRTLVFDYIDYSGKRHYKSFTAATKKESEYLAAEYSINKKMIGTNRYDDLFLDEAMIRYINDKSSTLSPNTLRGYKNHSVNHFDLIKNYKLKSIDTPTVQSWINSLNHLAPKTIKNAYGFLCSVLKYFGMDNQIHATLPVAHVSIGYIPTDNDVTSLIDYFRKTNNHKLVISVMLAAYGTLRLGEICALTSDDVIGNRIIVNKTIARKDGICILKNTPKSKSSNRIISLPQFVIDELPKEGNLINVTPDTITKQFKKGVRALELNDFRFHDLRHYAASIMHAIGIPDVYIMARGGWSSDKTLKEVYRNMLEDYNEDFTDKINTYATLMQHDFGLPQ